MDFTHGLCFSSLIYYLFHVGARQSRHIIYIKLEKIFVFKLFMINFAAKWTKNAIRAFISSRNFNPYNLANVVHITEREKRTIVGGDRERCKLNCS